MGPSDWKAQIFYPVDGDSAVYEMVSRGSVIEVWLEGIELEATGEDRVAEASIRIAISGDWEGDLDGLLDCLEEARARLLANEIGRAAEKPRPGT